MSQTKPYWVRALLCGTMALAGTGSLLAEAAPKLDPAVAECQPFEEWDQARVDRAGNLWLLRGEGTEIRRLSRDGQLVESVAVDGIRAFDADAEWGIAGLGRLGTELHGTELHIRRPGSSSTEIRMLEWEAGDVVWLSSTRVAVATTSASDAVVEVDVATGAPVAVLWADEPQIRIKEGAAFLRSLHLVADHSRERLHVLDSLGGEVRLLGLDGEPLSKSQVTAARLPGLIEWLESVDQQAREQGHPQTPYVRLLRAAVSVAGDTYVMEACTEARDQGTLAVIDADGNIERREVALPGPYCSLSFVRWENRLVFALPNADSWRCEVPPPRSPTVVAAVLQREV